MKKSILILIAICVQFMAYGQLNIVDVEEGETIGTVKPMGQFFFELKQYNNNTVKLLYKNAEYETIVDIKEISFKNENDEVEELYNTLLKGIQKKENNTQRIFFKNESVDLHFSRYGGVEIYHYVGDNALFVGRSYALTKKRLDKLFGKL